MQPQIVVTPAAPGGALASSNQAKAIELVQAQIAGVKKEIADLTSQLVPGTSDMRESVINDQVGAAGERLQSLQSQLDRMVTGDPNEAVAAFPPGFPDDIPQGVQDVAFGGMALVAALVLGYPIVRLFTRRLEPRPRAEPSADQSPRFERLEQAVDAVAIEVERISEGQRYTNKLLGEMRALPAPNPLEQWPLATRQKEGVAGSSGSAGG